MKRIIRKLAVRLVAAALVLFLSLPAHAFIPAVLAAISYANAIGLSAEITSLAAAVYLHAGIGGAAYLIYQGVFKDNSNPSVANSTSVGRSATVQWVDAKDIGPDGLPQVKQGPVSVKANYSDMRGKIKSPAQGVDPDYPNWQAALYKSSALDGAVGPTFSKGQVISYGGTLYTVTKDSVVNSYCGGKTTLSGGILDIHYGSNISGGCGSLTGWRSITEVTPGGTPTYIDRPNSEVASYVNANGVLTISSREELDKFISRYPGSVSVIDGPASSSDSAPPATLPAPAVQSDVDKKTTAAESAAAATAANGSALLSAQTALRVAQGNYSSSRSTSDAQKLADAQAAYDKLVADQAASTAQQAKDQLATDEQKAAVSGSGFKGAAYGDASKDFDLGNRFKTFFDQMRSTAVFSLPNQFLTNIPAGSTSSISFDGGRYGQHSFDFASLDSTWQTIKTIVLVVFGWLSIRIAVLKGGGG